MINSRTGVITAQECHLIGLFQPLGATQKIEGNAAMT